MAGDSGAALRPPTGDWKRSIGGIKQEITFTKDGKVYSIAGVGTMPKAATADFFRKHELKYGEVTFENDGKGLKGVMPNSGILPALVGTGLLVIGTITAALPLGIACAIYLSEYAKQNLITKAVRLAIVTLAGIPSIVFGLFGFGLFPFLN